jgi:hypothetical protein
LKTLKEDDQENPGGSEVGTTNPQEEKDEKNDAVVLLSAPYPFAYLSSASLYCLPHLFFTWPTPERTKKKAMKVTHPLDCSLLYILKLENLPKRR